MKSILTTAVFLISVLNLQALPQNEALAARASRCYDHSEWASASAMYILLSEKEPADPMPYSRIMVSESMRGDSSAVVSTLERALSAGIPLDSVTGRMFREAVSLGRPEIYEKALTCAAGTLSWLRRPLDVKLLDYYTFRRNPSAMIVYARKILAGAPEHVSTLLLLGRAYAMEGSFENALEAWRKAEAVQPDNYDVLIEIGNYYALNDSPEAIPYLKKAYALRPTPYLADLIKRLSEK